MKSPDRNALSLLLAVALLSACAPAPVRAPAAAGQCPPARDSALGEREMLRYNRCLHSLPTEGLAREYEGVTRHFAQTGNSADRVKLALLLSLPGTPYHDTGSALQLLGTAVPADLRQLADLLSASLAAQQALESRVHSLESDLAAEKQRSVALQAQIDSVKDLERNMTRRSAR
jgi:hypothetical protein